MNIYITHHRLVRDTALQCARFCFQHRAKQTFLVVGPCSQVELPQQTMIEAMCTIASDTNGVLASNKWHGD